MMLKIRTIPLFAAQIELKHNRRLDLVKTKTTTEAREAYMGNTGPLRQYCSSSRVSSPMSSLC